MKEVRTRQIIQVIVSARLIALSNITIICLGFKIIDRVPKQKTHTTLASLLHMRLEYVGVKYEKRYHNREILWRRV
jgi:hypothetical protein